MLTVPQSRNSPFFLWNLTFHGHVHNSRPVPILSPPPSPNPISLTSILILLLHLHLGQVEPFRHFPTTTLYVSFLYHMRATCTTHLIYLDLITPIQFGEEYSIRYESPQTAVCFQYPAMPTSQAQHLPQNPIPERPQYTFLP